MVAIKLSWQTSTHWGYVVFDAVFVSGSRIRDSSNRQPLCQVLQKGRYAAVNHTLDIFFISLSYTWTTDESRIRDPDTNTATGLLRLLYYVLCVIPQFYPHLGEDHRGGDDTYI